jgi:hypothetical protein
MQHLLDSSLGERNASRVKPDRHRRHRRRHFVAAIRDTRREANPAIDGAARRTWTSTGLQPRSRWAAWPAADIDYDADDRHGKLAARSSSRSRAGSRDRRSRATGPKAPPTLEVEGDARPRPELWDNIPDDVIVKAQALSDAMQPQRFAGQAERGPRRRCSAGLGPVGQACGACHEAYRQPDS